MPSRAAMRPVTRPRSSRIDAVACEWEWLGERRLPNATIPALVEFSLYAGIHRIDGKATGVLPDEDLPLLAIGIATRRGKRIDL